jgi:ubiquinone/menaquinone biosynthesis C-methylase UbiE
VPAPPPAATAEQIKDFNERYHDATAADYDAKWGIDFGPIGQDQVRRKLRRALGGWPESPYRDALELGCGTGYVSLNLLQLGVIERLVATDISQGMLDTLQASAGRLGLQVEAVRTEAERLPFDAHSFDLVFGHAVLHHIPNVERALVEIHRVLRPGGTLVFLGEPSRHGDRLASVPKRVAMATAPLWRALVGARAGGNGWDPDDGLGPHGGHHLEPYVDVHTFAPAELRRLLTAAGFTSQRIRGEELLANIHGWIARTLEASADPDSIPMLWRRFAFRSYLTLQRIDEALLEPRLPPQLFYNLVLSAHKPR